MTSIIRKSTYTYDTANRLTSVNGQAVQWDDNGNMLADGQAVYKYNTANKLVGVTKGTSSIVYAYSGLGDRLKQIADGVTYRTSNKYLYAYYQKYIFNYWIFHYRTRKRSVRLGSSICEEATQ